MRWRTTRTAGGSGGDADQPAVDAGRDREGQGDRGAAINESRCCAGGPQAAKLRVSIDGQVRLEELVCDGALVSTPAGSTAYNYSAHGPDPADRRGCAGADGNGRVPAPALAGRASTPDGSGALRRGRAGKAAGDGGCRQRSSTRDVISVEVRTDDSVSHRLLFDPGHGLEERLIGEQFVSRSCSSCDFAFSSRVGSGEVTKSTTSGQSFRAPGFDLAVKRRRRDVEHPCGFRDRPAVQGQRRLDQPAFGLGEGRPRRSRQSGSRVRARGRPAFPVQALHRSGREATCPA